MLDKAGILAAKDRETIDVEVPEWGGTARLMAMSAGDRDVFDVTCYDKLGKLLPGKSFRAELVARCLVDEAGVRMFGDGEIDALAAKSAAALERLFPAALKLNGMGDFEGLKGN